MVIFFSIITFILLLIAIFVLSVIHVRIEKLTVSNDNIKSKLEYNYSIFLELFFINKIKILSLEINKEKIEKLNIKEKLKNIDFNKMKQDVPNKKEIKQMLKILNINLSKINLSVKIGTENVIFTSAIVTILSALLGIILSKVIKQYDKDEQKYEIMPIYQNKNTIKLSLNCIIQVKMVHIICIIYLLIKKRRVEKNGRASNRRTYDYSYE